VTDAAPLTDTSAYQNTGKSLKDWKTILDGAAVSKKKRDEIVAFLQKEHGVQRYWADTLMDWYAGQ
jgi:hypothetical protein